MSVRVKDIKILESKLSEIEAHQSLMLAEYNAYKNLMNKRIKEKMIELKVWNYAKEIEAEIEVRRAEDQIIIDDLTEESNKIQYFIKFLKDRDEHDLLEFGSKTL